MINLVAFLTGSLLVVATCSLIYWYVVRPVVLKAILFRLFRKRDALRWMAISGEISKDSTHYKTLQDTLCKIISIAPSVNLFRFCMISTPQKSKETNVDDSPGEIEKMKIEAVEELVLILMINSPILVSVASVAILWMSAFRLIHRSSMLEKLRAILPDALKIKAEQIVDSVGLPA